MKQNSMLAMILAGGRGSRLHELTNKVAKPAVGYGGKYRIVDFPLSNCANRGIDVVGVLTQYESVLLNSYVAAGGRWGLDAKDSGVYVLPPREKADAGLDVYRGTADAISQNIDFINFFKFFLLHRICLFFIFTDFLLHIPTFIDINHILIIDDLSKIQHPGTIHEFRCRIIIGYHQKRIQKLR